MGVDQEKLNQFLGKFVGDFGPALQPRARGAAGRRLVLLTAFSLGCGGAGAAAPASSPAADPFDSTPSEPSIAVTADMGTPHVGDAAPDFALTAQDGSNVKLSSLRGSVVVLAFVTSWCPFSQAEQPHLEELAESYSGKKVKVVAVDIKETDGEYKAYLGRTKMSFPVVHDATGEATAAFTPQRAQPEVSDRSKVLVTSNLVIDPQGKIALFTMVDTVHFDARLVHVRRAVDRELARMGGM